MKKTLLILVVTLFTTLPAVALAAQNDTTSYCSCSGYYDSSYCDRR